jgi:Hemopexin
MAIDAALYSGSKCYFFHGSRSLRVTRGDTGPATVDSGHPAAISNWGGPEGSGRSASTLPATPGPSSSAFTSNRSCRSRTTRCGTVEQLDEDRWRISGDSSDQAMATLQARGAGAHLIMTTEEVTSARNRDQTQIRQGREARGEA